MGGQPKNVTQTSRTEPPKWLLPYLKGAAEQLTPAYEQSGRDYAGLRGLLQNQPGDLTSQIQQQFNAVSPGIQSQFAMAGRSGSGMETDILGRAFGDVALRNVSADRARQLQEAEALANLEYGRLGGYTGLISSLMPGSGSTSSAQPYFRGSGLGGTLGGIGGGILGALIAGPGGAAGGYGIGSGLGSSAGGLL